MKVPRRLLQEVILTAKKLYYMQSSLPHSSGYTFQIGGHCMGEARSHLRDSQPGRAPHLFATRTNAIPFCATKFLEPTTSRRIEVDSSSRS